MPKDQPSDVDLSATAHTVCNLLTSLRLSGSQLLYDNDPKTVENYIKEADSMINSAVSAIQHMTLLDRIQRNTIRPTFVRTDVTKLMHRTIESRRYKWSHNGVRINLSGERVVRATDGFFLEMVIGELLDNACRYKSKDVDVMIDTAGDRTKLTIKDDGEGIEPAELSQVFDPYFRIAKHRARNRRAGLGLTTVKAVTNKLEGDVKLDSNPNWGTRVEILI